MIPALQISIILIHDTCLVFRKYYFLSILYFIVISKYSSSNTSSRKNKKIVIPREIKANHMDCHDYTNKVQYTKVISSIPKVTQQSFPNNSSRNEIRQSSSYTAQSSPINISPLKDFFGFTTHLGDKKSGWPAGH